MLKLNFTNKKKFTTLYSQIISYSCSMSDKGGWRRVLLQVVSLQEQADDGCASVRNVAS